MYVGNYGLGSKEDIENGIWDAAKPATKATLKKVATPYTGQAPDIAKPFLLSAAQTAARGLGLDPAKKNISGRISSLVNEVIKEVLAPSKEATGIAAAVVAAAEAAIAAATAPTAAATASTGVFAYRPKGLLYMPGTVKTVKEVIPLVVSEETFMSKLTSPVGLVAIAAAGVIGYMVLKKK